MATMAAYICCILHRKDLFIINSAEDEKAKDTFDEHMGEDHEAFYEN